MANEDAIERARRRAEEYVLRGGDPAVGADMILRAAGDYRQTSAGLRRQDRLWRERNVQMDRRELDALESVGRCAELGNHRMHSLCAACNLSELDTLLIVLRYCYAVSYQDIADYIETPGYSASSCRRIVIALTPRLYAHPEFWVMVVLHETFRAFRSNAPQPAPHPWEL